MKCCEKGTFVGSTNLILLRTGSDKSLTGDIENADYL